MANLIKLEIVRLESGSGHSMRVSFTIRASYTDCEPFQSPRIDSYALLVQLRQGNVPYTMAFTVGCNGGTLTKENGVWTLQS
jgi:hypothetical protein